jgi:hypothetical protein
MCGATSDVVHGVLFEIAADADWEQLDRQEGTGLSTGYERRGV